MDLSFGQELAGLGGDVDHIRTTVAASAEQSFFNEDVTVVASFEAGNITAVGDNTSTRQANRFFNSQRQLRGFESAGIGPRDLIAGSDPLGGNNYFATRLEAQFPIGFIPEEYGMSGAVFADMGSVWGLDNCLLYTSPSPRDLSTSRMPSSA